MKRRHMIVAVVGLCAALAASTAALGSAKRSSATGTISVLGSYSGPDQQSFRAVLDGFATANPGVSATYGPAGANLEATLDAALKSGKPPDIAVLSLPAQADLMRKLAAEGALKPIGFVASALDANYAFAWKMLGSVNGTLYALPYKATNQSAFLFDRRLFKNAGIQTSPANWHDFQRIAGSLRNTGIKPFSIAGADGSAVANLFANVYLGQQGQARYEQLAEHKIKWTDPSVKAALELMRRMFINPASASGGLQKAVATTFPTAVMQVVGAPAKAAMVFGGSAVLPVLHSAKAARPLTDFGVFAFPPIGKPPARVIGQADVVVMLKDTAAARALVQYLATPEAATIWVKRGGFLSPNRKVDLASYPLATSRALATQLTQASAFRLDLTMLQSAPFGTKLAALMHSFVKSPSRIDQISEQLEAAAAQRFKL
jgi:alpha-glucoside transport system substrate-binding protein